MTLETDGFDQEAPPEAPLRLAQAATPVQAAGETPAPSGRNAVDAADQAFREALDRGIAPVAAFRSAADAAVQSAVALGIPSRQADIAGDAAALLFRAALDRGAGSAQAFQAGLAAFGSSLSGLAAESLGGPSPFLAPPYHGVLPPLSSAVFVGGGRSMGSDLLGMASPADAFVQSRRDFAAGPNTGTLVQFAPFLDPLNASQLVEPNVRRDSIQTTSSTASSNGTTSLSGTSSLTFATNRDDKFLSTGAADNFTFSGQAEQGDLARDTDFSDNDTVSLTYTGGANTFGVAGIENLVLPNSAFKQTISIMAGGSITITLNTTGVNDISTNAGDPTYGNGTTNVVTFANAAKTTDTLDLGAGTDTLTLSNGTNGVTLANVEVVNLSGTSAQNVLTLGTAASAVTLAGTSRTDDALTLASGTNSVTLSAIESVTGGSGADAVTYSAAITGAVVDLGAGTDTLTLATGTNSVTTRGIESIIGGGGNDTIILASGSGFTASTVIDLGGGTADLITLQVSTTATFGASSLLNVESVSLSGGTTYNLTTVDANVGSGQILAVDGTGLGSTGTMIFDGSAETNGRFNITGTNSSDTITGGAGNDTIAIGVGTDTVSAGAGNDTITVSGPSFTAADILDGGTGTADVINLSGATTITFGASTVLNVESIVMSAGADYVIATVDATVASGATLNVSGANIGTGNSLVFTGNAETDGTFVITGGSGQDTILGGSGGDTIDGGLGGDTLYGFGGADSLTGGSGADIFLFTGGSAASMGQDVILDFTAGTDKLLFDRSDLLAGGAVTFGNGDVNSIPTANVFVVNDATGYASVAAAAAAIAGGVNTQSNAIFIYFDTTQSKGMVVHTTDANNDGTETVIAVLNNLTTPGAVNAIATGDIQSQA